MGFFDSDKQVIGVFPFTFKGEEVFLVFLSNGWVNMYNPETGHKITLPDSI